MALAPDKVAHFLACFGATLAAALFVPWWAAAPCALTIGAGKEGWDIVRPNGTGWSWSDILADAAGVAAALVLLAARGLLR